MNQYLRILGVSVMLGMLLVASAPALAVRLNSDGLGEVLIYPYYTAQVDDEGSAYNSLLSLTNDTNTVKAIKLRIREGRIGDEAGSFNLLLGPHDMWTAALVPDGNNLRIITHDTSCINPAVGAQGVILSLSGNPAQRVREGYIEMYEMGGMTGDAAMFARHAQGKNYEWIPASCEKAFASAARDTTAANTGGLTGVVVLINVQAGFSFSTKAVALEQFVKPGTALGYTDIGNEKPNLTSAEPISIVPGEGEDMLLISTWEVGTPDAVSAVLMHDRVLNEFVASAGTDSKTNWVLTFPTKAYYYKKAEGGVREVSKLFDQDFSDTNGALDRYTSFMRDREGRIFESCGWAGCPLPSISATKWVSNILTGSSTTNLFFSRNDVNFYAHSADYESGQIDLSWTRRMEEGKHRLMNYLNTTVVRVDGSEFKNQTRKYYGLPVIGFSAYNYTNAGINLPDGKVGRSIYGVAEPHAYKNRIE